MSPVASPSKSAVYTRPWLYPKQRDALFTDARYGVIEASTKTGKTVGSMVWLLEQAMTGGRGKNYWWVAPVYLQSAIAFRRFKRGLPPSVFLASDSKLWLALGNGAVIWFKSAEDPDKLYGEDVYAAVFDEATRAKEEAWFALRSTLTATEGPVRIIGNVKGRRNWAYRLARRAEAGSAGYSYAKLTAFDAADAGVLTREEIADARRTLPESVFRELYLAEPSEDGGNPFSTAAIRSALSPTLSREEPVVFGVDLGKSVDWTVVVGLDAKGRVCRFGRWQLPWKETVLLLRTVIRSTPALIDSTGVGDPILEALQRPDGGLQSQPNFQGLVFTAQAKQQLMEGLAVGLQQESRPVLVDAGVGAGGGRAMDDPGWMQLELEQFEFVVTRTGVRYSAPEGLHDDCVCALALAWKHWNAHARRMGTALVW